MTRRTASLLALVAASQLGTGCCLFPNLGWRVREHRAACRTCSPAFAGPAYSGSPVYSGGPAYGPVAGPGCPSCYGPDGGGVPVMAGPVLSSPPTAYVPGPTITPSHEAPQLMQPTPLAPGK